MTTKDLYHTSIQLIKANQHEKGAYVACPNFEAYRYGWLRDGSFIAYAMDLASEYESSAAFHRWVGSVLERYADKMENLIQRGRAGEHISQGEQMHTRFTLDGEEAGEAWGNFQLDGYGTWLWSLIEHVRKAQDATLYDSLRPQVARVIRYLHVFWHTPCFDCWEERGDQVHTGTLLALFGGIRAAADHDMSLPIGKLLEDIDRAIRDECTVDGHLIKSVGNPAVDANLLGAHTPYRFLDADDEILHATVARIESELGRVGVHRYREDTYYGGGAWVLLSAWLGWHHATLGNVDRAREIRDWVLAQAAADGSLCEQTDADLLAPSEYQVWRDRCGPSATPLLWSHAMFIILEHSI
jgi:GH15 family glucan-1,4-alpha-glucosidase